MVWDSQVQNGYKRSRETADSEQASVRESCPAAAAWDGKKSSSVVEELLKNATDKAYGTEGEVSLVLLHAQFLFVNCLFFLNMVFPSIKSFTRKTMRI